MIMVGGFVALLIVAAVALTPRSAPAAGDFSRAKPWPHNDPHVAAPAGSREQWAVVIDAGSTGSRVHIFKFLVIKGHLELQFDKFEQLKPGLSSYAGSPADAAASLKPLLDLAAATVPTVLHPTTPITLGATAGLRLLPDRQADDILDAARATLRALPFRFANDDVKILSGVDEGAFAWLTLNYLLGKLGGPEEGTVAAIDLGGGSVQEAFAMSATEAATAPDPAYITRLQGGGKQYQVYVHSYLGYGMMAGRAAVLSESTAGRDSHPCVPKGFSGKYEYAGATMDMVGGSSSADRDACSAIVLSAMKHQAECGAPQLHCTFNGAWAGSRVPGVFYISSYFWDRAADAGLLPDANAIQAAIRPQQFGEVAHKACRAGSIDDVGAAFPALPEELRPFWCLDLVYAHSLLTKGFKIKENSIITLVKRVDYKGEHVEAAWPLGAAINLLG
jgi:apyrase